MKIAKRKFKCTGCGEARPCFLETNQEKGVIDFYDQTEDLKCVLDSTNQTSYNWKEIEQELTLEGLSNEINRLKELTGLDQ